MPREKIEVEQDTTRHAEPVIPVKIPLGWFRWLMYSGLMILLLGPFKEHIGVYCCLTGGLILGHFASQLNALINKKP